MIKNSDWKPLKVYSKGPPDQSAYEVWRRILHEAQGPFDLHRTTFPSCGTQLGGAAHGS